MWNAIAEHTVFLRYLIFFVKGIKLVLFYTQAAKNTHTHTLKHKQQHMMAIKDQSTFLHQLYWLHLTDPIFGQCPCQCINVIFSKFLVISSHS